MRRYFVNLDTNNLQSGRSDTGGIGQTARGAAGAVALQFGGQDQFQIGFIRTGGQTNLDMGTNINGILVLKQPVTGSEYDGPPLTKCLTWTKTTIDGQIWYVGNLDLAKPELAKLLGVSIRTQPEKLLVQCVADVDSSLDGTTLKIAITRGSGSTPTHYCYFDLHVSTGIDTPVSGGDHQDRVTLGANDSADLVAAKLRDRVNARTGDIGYTATASGANLTLTATDARLIGQHDALSSGFALALLAVGGVAGALADVASAPLNAEFSFVPSGGSREICRGFSTTLRNTLFREGQLSLPSGLQNIDALNLIALASGVTAYNGTTNALDGLATANGAIRTGQMFWFVHATDGLQFFQLVSGTNAESSPTIIRPDDYNGSTNARVWKNKTPSSSPDYAAVIDTLLASTTKEEIRVAAGMRRTDGGESIDMLDTGTVGGWVWAYNTTASSPDGSFLSPYVNVQAALDASHRKIKFISEHTVDVSAMSGRYAFFGLSGDEGADGIYFTGTPAGALTIIGNGARSVYISGDVGSAPVTIESTSVPYFHMTAADGGEGSSGESGCILTIKNAITGSLSSTAGVGGAGSPGDGETPGGAGGDGGSGNGIRLINCIETGTHSTGAAPGGSGGSDGGAGAGSSGTAGTPAGGYAFSCFLLGFSPQGHSGNGGFIRYQMCRVAGVAVVDTSYYSGSSPSTFAKGAATA